MRSRSLVEGMLDDFQVTFLNGGELVPGFAFPAAVDVINLPPLKADAAFTTLEAGADECLTEIKATRAQLLLDTYARLQPEILVIELFPFGRKKFAFELLPLLAQIRRNAALGQGRPTKVVCSLRDIMVSRRDQWKHEARACRILNRYFDLLLVHADPAFQRLEESFGQTAALTIPIVYTGYVAQRDESCPPAQPPLRAREEQRAPALMLEGVGVAVDPLCPDATPINLINDRPLLLASIGGGRVGSELLLGTVAASIALITTLPHQLLIFTGPYIPEDEFAQLAHAVAGHAHIILHRYTNHFLHYMAQADLSLSMAGYNTCMNIVATGTRALVLPFTGGNNDEQTIRAAKLAARGAVDVLQPADLTADQLALRISAQLAKPANPATLDLDGVAHSVTALHKLIPPKQPHTVLAHTTRAYWRSAEVPGATLLDNQLRPFLEQWGAAQGNGGNAAHLFLRDDDIDEDEDTLCELLDVALARGVPINLEIIPGMLTDACARLIADCKRFTPNLVQLDQHGWQHTNHELAGRKCEFGPSRSYAEQYDDIARGKALLESALPELVSPVFTPPWNRCTVDTFRVLDELGFSVFSGLRGKAPVDGYGFEEISVTLDLYRWKGGAAMKAPSLIIEELIAQIRAGQPIGLLLHHKVMERPAFAFLDQLLLTLRDYSFIAFHTFESLQQRSASMVEHQRLSTHNEWIA